MATKNFNPFKDAYSALQFLLMLTPPESRQQAIKAVSVIKTSLDEQKNTASNHAVLAGHNEILREQILTLQAELTALQFSGQPEPEVVEEKKRGRKPNANG